MVTRTEAGRALCQRAIEKYVDIAAARDYRDLIDEQQEEVHDLILELMGGAR